MIELYKSTPTRATTKVKRLKHAIYRKDSSMLVDMKVS